jgi:hypothetical protein
VQLGEQASRLLVHVLLLERGLERILGRQHRLHELRGVTAASLLRVGAGESHLDVGVRRGSRKAALQSLNPPCRVATQPRGHVDVQVSQSLVGGAVLVAWVDREDRFVFVTDGRKESHRLRRTPEIRVLAVADGEPEVPVGTTRFQPAGTTRRANGRLLELRLSARLSLADAFVVAILGEPPEDVEVPFAAPRPRFEHRDGLPQLCSVVALHEQRVRLPDVVSADGQRRRDREEQEERRPADGAAPRCAYWRVAETPPAPIPPQL